MQGADPVRIMVRERYGAIARKAGSCCAPSCCGPELAPDGLSVIGDAYEGVAARIAAAGAAAATVDPHRAEADPQLARLRYPSNRLANVSDLKPNAPLQVAYPDAERPASF